MWQCFPLSDGIEREGPLERNERHEGYRWIILSIVYLSILAFTFIFQSVPPILSLIISDLELTYAQAGLLMSLFALPGLLVSLPGGFLSDRYPMRPVATGCFLFMLAGILLVGLGKDIHVLWLGRVIAGIGGLTLSILLPKLLAQWFGGKGLGLAMGIFNTGVPLGSIICFGLFGRMGNLWGWRIPILSTGIYSLITAILFLSFYQLPSSQAFENRGQEGLSQSLGKMGLPIWWVGVAWLWFNAAFISFATFAPNFFLQKGYTIEQSGFLTGIPLLGSLFLSPLTGILVDRFRHQEWLIGIGGVALSILVLSFNFGASFVLLVTLMGIFSATIPAPIYSLPPELLRSEHLGLGFGVISTCSSVGLFVAPYLVGKAKDMTGSDGFGFAMISMFFLLTVVSIFFVHRRTRQFGVRS